MNVMTSSVIYQLGGQSNCLPVQKETLKAYLEKGDFLQAQALTKVLQKSGEIEIVSKIWEKSRDQKRINQADYDRYFSSQHDASALSELYTLFKKLGILNPYREEDHMRFKELISRVTTLEMEGEEKSLLAHFVSKLNTFGEKTKEVANLLLPKASFQSFLALNENGNFRSIFEKISSASVPLLSVDKAADFAKLRQEMLEVFFTEHPFASNHDFRALFLSKKSFYRGSADFYEKDAEFLDHFIRELTGKDVRFLMSKYAWVYLAHISSKEGTMGDGKTTDSTGKKETQSLSGFDAARFFTLRMRVLAGIIFEIETGALSERHLTTIENKTGLVNEYLDILYQEFAICYETFWNDHKANLIASLTSSFWNTDPLYLAMAKRIHQYSRSHLFCLYTGYSLKNADGSVGGHAIYCVVAPGKEDQSRLFSFFNLGFGSDVHHKPAIFRNSAWRFAPYRFYTHEKIEDYIADIFRQSNWVKPPDMSDDDFKTERLQRIYLPEGRKITLLEPLATDYKKTQNVGNCVAKGFRASMIKRLQDRLQDHKEVKKFTRWLKKKEGSYLYLTSAHCRKEEKMQNGLTPILKTAQEGFWNKSLYELVEKAKSEGYSDLHLAILRDNLAQIKGILAAAKGSEELSKLTLSGNNALMLALLLDSQEGLQCIEEKLSTLDMPALPLNQQNRYGETALHLARAYWPEKLEELEVLSISKELKNNEGLTYRQVKLLGRNQRPDLHEQIRQLQEEVKRLKAENTDLHGRIAKLHAK